MNSDASNTADQALCPHCFVDVDALDHFCPECGGPVTAHASIDPLGQVYAAGRAYQNATDGSPKLIILIGVWLIFGTSVPLLLFATSIGLYEALRPTWLFEKLFGQDDVISSPHWFFALVFSMVGCAVLWLHISILWKTTTRYRKARREEQQAQQDGATRPS